MVTSRDCYRWPHHARAAAVVTARYSPEQEEDDVVRVFLDALSRAGQWNNARLSPRQGPDV